MDFLLYDAYERSLNYLKHRDMRSVFPTPAAIKNLERLNVKLPDAGLAPAAVLQMLDEYGSPAATASAGGRYFGFVIGGSLPAALAANWLAGAWDQNAGLYAISPVAARLEEISEGWLVDLLGLQEGTAVGFVSGATMANFTALAAARHALMERAGWNVEDQGLYGAPEIKVVVGDEYHASMRKALVLIGFGRERVHKVPVDDQGRMIVKELPELDELTLVCAQSGNVNTGSFDDVQAVCEKAKAAGAWVHVDAAFGLWARVAPELAHLAAGIEMADSIATDAHKWLNVPYDSGLVFVKNREALIKANVSSAAYLIESGKRENYFYAPEMSRRARGVEIWAALLSLGRNGLAEMVSRCCRHARRFAAGLKEAGYEILNDVVLNQVLVSFGSPEKTQEVIRKIGEEGTMWAGGTSWQGHTAMRISVSSWATTDEDVEKSLEAIVKIARSVSK
jgi:glutamate/tyrosine decarboxylase-like PLP-dependent enzyme